MHLFFSVGEPSGDQHAAEVIREIVRRHPGTRISGFGGTRMEQAGCERLYPLADIAVMGFFDVLPLLWTFLRLIRQAGRWLREQRPDAVVLVDAPAFNWWIARRAKKLGIPVFYYLPPQLWAWAPWRIRKVRKFVDRVVSPLPFEAEWYRERGVSVEFVGHPFFDEVARHELDRDTMARLRSGGRVVGVLPGSRTKEVTRNFPVMLRVIEELNARHFDLRFAVACYKPAHRELCRSFMLPEHERLPLELYVGRTSEIIEAAECCLMVSGSVSLELLARSTPGVVMYRGTWMLYVLGHLLIRCRFLTLVNLLAGREVMPEFPFVLQNSRCVDEMTRWLDLWLSAESERQSVMEELTILRHEVAQPGGIARAATAILTPLNAPVQKQAA